MDSPFELFLFSTQPAIIARAVAAGVDGIVVDWEYHGKEARQAGADTQINRDTLEDLQRVRESTPARVICRINQFGPHTPGEVAQAIEAGTDEIMLPMVRTVLEVNRALELARGRCGVGILVETAGSLQLLSELARLPLRRVYVGLNDLAIDRKTPNIFTAISDGTIEYVSSFFKIPFGFGGLTLPDRGSPIPCRLLMGEMARLDCSFSFLRRSFYRDIQGREYSVEVPRMRAALEGGRRRLPMQVLQDQAQLHQAIDHWVVLAN